MAVEQGLINSGASIYADDTVTDVGGAVKAGQDEAEAQRVTRRKERQDDEEREYKIKRLQDEEELRELGLEQVVTQANAERGELISLADQLIERGDLPGVDYDAYLEDRKDGILDEATQLKIFAASGKDSTAALASLNTLTDAESNFGKFQEHAATMTISGNSTEAYKMNLAVSAWKGDVPPATVKKGNKRYFKLPLPGSDPIEEILVPVDGIATGDFDSAYGAFEEKSSFAGTTATWQKDNEKQFDRLSKGTGTSTDVAAIGAWYQDQVKNNPVKAQEILDTFFVQSGITVGSAAAKELGLEDVNNDGLLTSADVSDADMAEVFTGAIFAEFDFAENQQGDQIVKDRIDKELKRGKYKEAPKAGKGSGAKGFGPDSSLERRIGTAFNGGKIVDLTKSIVGLKVDGKTIGFVRQDEKGNWIATSQDQKASYDLTSTPTAASIRDAFGADPVDVIPLTAEEQAELDAEFGDDKLDDDGNPIVDDAEEVVEVEQSSTDLDEPYTNVAEDFIKLFQSGSAQAAAQEKRAFLKSNFNVEIDTNKTGWEEKLRSLDPKNLSLQGKGVVTDQLQGLKNTNGIDILPVFIDKATKALEGIELTSENIDRIKTKLYAAVKSGQARSAIMKKIKELIAAQ